MQGYGKYKKNKNFLFVLLCESLDFRNKKIVDLTESPLIISDNDIISKMIDILLETNASDIFIPIGKSISSINIRDILPIRDISNAKISLLGKKITALTVM